METLHFSAGVRDRAVDLREEALARRIWEGLQRAFPQVLAVLLMPEHLHVLLDAAREELERERLWRTLARATTGRGRGVWEPLEPGVVVPNRLHRNRSIRYILLNPCRRGLVGDPAAWPWSTYRDVMGAIVDPWTTPSTLAPRMGWPTSGFEARFHGYVSSDPSVAVEGTPRPRAARPARLPEQGLEELVAATAAALRTSPDGIQRRGPARDLFVALARRQGWRRSAEIARQCGVTPSTVRRIWDKAEPPGLDAAALCLGDERLLGAPAPRTTKTR